MILLTGSLNLITIIESQRVISFLFPLFPLFLIFFIGSIAETNRAPFDLAEAEPKKLAKAFQQAVIVFVLISLSLTNKHIPFILIRWYHSDTLNNNNNTNSTLHPYWVTGFTDAEGSFSIKFTKSNSYKLGWRIQPQFTIKLHERDLALLQRIKEFFGVGTLIKDGTKIAYTVKSIEDLTKVIIPPFERFPLLTKKFADFVIFKEIVFIMANKEHLLIENFKKILSLKANLNLGLSEELKKAFPDIIQLPRPDVPLREIPNPQWLTGFIDGEGCFIINISKSSSTHKTDKVWLTFQITQHSRDTMLMQSIVKYLDCGRVANRSNTPAVDFLVTRFSDIDANWFFKQTPSTKC